MSGLGTRHVSGSAVVYAHTVLGYAAFLAAFVIGVHLHYRRIVKNGVAGYPYEWLPSVSATMCVDADSGDWFPERNIFQVIIAVTSGPRFLLVTLCAIQALHTSLFRAATLFATGMLRTLSCGGWMYITSSDHGLVHDVGMGVYLALTPVWMILCSTSLGGNVGHAKAQRLRAIAAALFYMCVPFMVYFYIQHKVKHVPGAYSIYAIFEWTLVFMDVLFDHAASWDVAGIDLSITHKVPAPKPVPVLKETQASVAPATQRKVASAQPAASDPLVLALFAARVYLAFIAWSACTVLPSTVFYFSVSNMAALGHEAFIASQFVVVALAALPPLNRIASSRALWLRSALWTGILMSLPLYVSDSAPFTRLVCTGASAGAAALVTALEFTHAWEDGALVEQTTVFLLGLILHIVAKFWNHGNSPVWPYLDKSNGGWHFLCFHIGLACVAVLLFVPRTSPVQQRTRKSYLTLVTSAAGLGAWLIEMHTLLSDSGTMIVWGWAGYPINGPVPVLHGALVVVATAVGTLVAMYRPTAFVKPAVFIADAVATGVLLKQDGWPSFAGAVVIALTLPGMAVPLLHGTLSHAPLAALAVMWLVYTLLEFLGVLTVAYAFLPGAYVMREHTGAMLLVQHVLIGVGLCSAGDLRAEIPRRAFRRAAIIATMLLAGAAALVPFYRYVPSKDITPHYPEDRVLTAGIWTVHFGFDQNMRDSSRRMADILKTLKMDVVGLLETDLHRPCFGNRDLSQYLAEQLRMHVDIGPSPKKHTWGAVLLSKVRHS